MKEENIIDRKDLYNLVWSKPVTQIAKDFGISDVAVSKICKKLNIPKPGLGYWAKKQFGKRTRQTPLPPLKAGDPENYTIKGSMDANLNLTSEFIEKQKAFENRPASEVKVKQSLRNPHPLVHHSIQRLRDEHADQSKRYRGGRGCVDVWVSKESIHRALLIMDALIKALEKRGFPVSLKDQHQDNTSVEINGESILFGIVEASRQIPNPKRETDRWENRYDYIPTGKLTLRIKNYYRGQKSISDGKTQRLEDCLNKFNLLLVKASEIEKIRRKEREERHKEYQERVQKEREVALKQQKEQNMLKELFANADTWNKCKQAREYIAAYKDTSAGIDVDSWVNWANAQVDRIESKLLSITHESITLN
ncbi:MAG: hypothetical protein H8D23_04630 [Candidatus Brocadiales bacterium]|nr:hypothetical protein [Candidatus Brocadiales bacterium]